MSEEDIKHIVVISSCPGSISAKKMAQELVAERLVACVNIIPGVQSFFRWVGKLDNSNEHMLIMKTTLDRYAELEQRIKKIHPYELPEIIAVPIETGLPDYLDWVTKNSRKS